MRSARDTSRSQSPSEKCVGRLNGSSDTTIRGVTMNTMKFANDAHENNFPRAMHQVPITTVTIAYALCANCIGVSSGRVTRTTTHRINAINPARARKPYSLAFGHQQRFAARPCDGRKRRCRIKQMLLPDAHLDEGDFWPIISSMTNLTAAE